MPDVSVLDSVTLVELLDVSGQPNLSVAENIAVTDIAALWDWGDTASMHTTTPTVLIDIFWSSGRRRYSTDFVRTPWGQYKGNILSLPTLSSSVGGIKRTFERANVTVLFSDTDYEFRTLEEAENPGLKNTRALIRIAFEDDNFATTATLWNGHIYDWKREEGLKYFIALVQNAKNVENFYPDKVVEKIDYTYADTTAVGVIIPVPYGVISNYGDTDNGAFPTLFVDTTTDSEKHLVGRQYGGIIVNRVYIDGVLKTPTTHYTVSTQTIDGMIHTEIHWQSGVNPTDANLVTCDITYQLPGGLLAPVAAIRDFLIRFCDYDTDDFNADSTSAARDTEDARGYSFSGALYESETLRTILDKWREEYELDIYWNTGGEICFRYTSAIAGTGVSLYEDYLHVFPYYSDTPQVRELMNHLTYSYNYDYARQYYHNRGMEEDASSQERHSGEYRDSMTMRWIRSSSVASDITARKIARFGNPITFLSLSLPLLSYEEGVTDVVKLTHFDGAGSGGYDETLMQVRKINQDLNNFTNRLILEDTNDLMKSYCCLGDRAALAPNWLVASDADKQYFYVCDQTTGIFSNGDRGKQLFD